MSDKINWEKIEEKPEKDYKVPGTYLLSERQTIANQEDRIEQQNAIILEIKKEVENLNFELQTRNNKILELSSQTIPALNQEIAQLKETNQMYEDLKTTMEEEISGFNDIVEELKQNDKLKEEILTEKSNKIEELMNGLEKFQKRVDELEKLIETLPTIDEVENMKGEIKGKGEEITNLLKRIDELEQQPPPEPLVSEDELEELRKRPTPEVVEKSIVEKDKKIGELESELSLKEKMIDDLSSQIQDLQEKVSAKTVIPTSKPEEKAPYKPHTEKIVGGFSKIEPSLIKPSERAKFKDTEPVSPSNKFGVFGSSSESSKPAPKGALNPQVAQLMNNVKESILKGVFANELAKLLEDTRDQIAGIIGFKIVLNEIGNIARKLKKAPPNAQIDDQSVEIFLQKIEEWSERLK